MIHSMTAFGSARVDLAQGSLALEIRSVNSRFLDLHFRLPEDLRQAESPLRDLLTARLGRGKVEVRASFTRVADAASTSFDPAWLAQLAAQLQQARTVIPDVAAPRLVELSNWPGQRGNDAMDPQAWSEACVAAAQEALKQLEASRAREGERLAGVMLTCADDIAGVVDHVTAHLPALLAEHREKLATKLRDTVASAFPSGFANISGGELSERLAQESTLFALRIDVAEEIARLRSHLTELRHILGAGEASDAPPPAPTGKQAKSAKRPTGSAGKRLDFLFQEMNREANTLGSKASSLDVTRAAMDLKLLIEQMREQAQNIE